MAKKGSPKGKPAPHGQNGARHGQFGSHKGGVSRGAPMVRRPPRQPGR
jgi:hypothetical protein